jgi:hypothetical protein
MKKTTLQIFTIGLLLAGLIGCNGVSKSDFEALKSENEKLKQEIEDFKYGPDKLLSQAKVFIENKDFNKAVSELETLINKHPASTQVSEAKQLITVAEEGIKKQKLADEKANAEKEKAEKERLANATKKLRTSVDEIKGITWYYSKGTPQYTNYNSFHLYMGKENNGKPWLRFRIQYTADDWLFIESYVIKTDNNSYTISPSHGEVETDNGSGGIWEWYDVQLDSKLYNIVKDVITSKSVKLRHNGKQYYKDRTINEKEKQGLQEILNAFEALGGTNNF